MTSALPGRLRWLPILAAVAATACASDAEPAPAPVPGADTGSVDAATDEASNPPDAPDVRTDARMMVDARMDAVQIVDARDAEAPSSDSEQPPSSDASDAIASPPLCLRLEDPMRSIHVYELSAAVRVAYGALVEADCRVVDLLNESDPARVNWYNALYAFGVDLWGCRDKKAKTFALVHEEVVDLTSSDAALLIDLYLQATKQIIELTTTEEAALRRELQALAAMAITRQSPDLTFSACGGLDAGTEVGDPDGGSTAPDSSLDGGSVADAASREASNEAGDETGEDAGGE